MKNSTTSQTTKKVVIASLFTALTCVATMIIKIPSPLKGYMNFGDSVVLLSGWMLSPLYGFFASGVGSGMADLFSGYVMYAPVTFLIKGVMAVVAFYLYKILRKSLGEMPSRVLSGAVSEIIMATGYYVFEGFLYGFKASLVNVPANVVQGVAGLVLGIILVGVFTKAKINFD